MALATGQGTVTPTFEFGVGSTPEGAHATLQQLLAMSAEVASQRKRRVALVLDEFQAILDIDSTLPRRMRAVVQFQADVSHVYLGSKQTWCPTCYSDLVARQLAVRLVRCSTIRAAAPRREPSARD